MEIKDKIMRIIYEESKRSFYGKVYLYSACIADTLSISKSECLQLLRELKSDGLILLDTVFSDEGRVAGRAWGLTKEGEEKTVREYGEDYIDEMPEIASYWGSI